MKTVANYVVGRTGDGDYTIRRITIEDGDQRVHRFICQVFASPQWDAGDTAQAILDFLRERNLPAPSQEKG